VAKIKLPFLSFSASGPIGKVLSIRKRGRQHIAEEKPIPKDAKSPNQLIWRHMYSKCSGLWHDLSSAEQQEWESLARPRHMTGYAWFISQCLRPNPGIYLPLQGGTMQGLIQMDGHHIHGLPLPIHVQDPWRRQDFQTYTLPYLYNEGARVYSNVDQTIPKNTWATLALNAERYDNDAIHDPVTNNSRLTCKTAGKYVISAMVAFESGPTGTRWVVIKLNGTTAIASQVQRAAAVGRPYPNVTTQYHLAVNDYVEIIVRHDDIVDRDVEYVFNESPEFAMQRIGL